MAFTSLDTRVLPEHRRSQLWSRATARFLVPLDIRAENHPVTGHIAGVRREDVSFCRLHASPHFGVRTPDLTKGIGNECYKIALALHGRVQVSQHGRIVALSPGELAVYDTGEEYSVGGQIPFGLLIALIPRHILNLNRDRIASVAATALRSDEAAWSLAGAATGRVTPGEAIASVRDLISTARPLRLGRKRNHEGILTAARELINDHLDDPELTPEYLAAVLGVSRRYLYGVFSTQIGPVSLYIRSRRLTRARDMLRDPIYDEMTIAQIAMAVGFTDPAHFSRTYRTTYGYPPRKERQGRGVSSA